MFCINFPQNKTGERHRLSQQSLQLPYVHLYTQQLQIFMLHCFIWEMQDYSFILLLEMFKEIRLFCWLSYQCICPIIFVDPCYFLQTQLSVFYYFIIVTVSINRILYSLQPYCSPSYMQGLPFYSHVEHTGMTASFHKEGRFGPIKLV